jgi:GT2 family glycosyltransferase
VKLSVVIPSSDGRRDGNLARLLDDVEKQTLRPAEVEVVVGVSPNGRARNVGIQRCTGNYFIFLDDDVRLGHNGVFEALVSALVAHPEFGITGTAQQLPPDSTFFQRAAARQIPRSHSPVVPHFTESDMVTTACWAMPRAVLDRVGWFNDRIPRGVDPEMRQRVRAAGYKIICVPGVWHYHPMPATLRALLRMAWRNGAASAYARRHYPQYVFNNPEGHVGAFAAQTPFPVRLLRAAGRTAVHAARLELIGLLYQAAYLGGYLSETRCPARG